MSTIAKSSAKSGRLSRHRLAAVVGLVTAVLVAVPSAAHAQEAAGSNTVPLRAPDTASATARKASSVRPRSISAATRLAMILSMASA